MKKLKLIPLILLSSLIFSGCKEILEPLVGEVNPSRISSIANASAVSGDEFTIAVIPDTQYYLEEDQGGTFQMFKDQIDWIKANRVAENIVYVAGVGDIVDNGDFKSGSYPDSNSVEWDRAKYYYQLETPFAGNPYGIPYGLAVGNHDQTGHEYPLSFSNPALGFTTNHTTGFYNKYFGVSHFAGRPYYGGSYTATEANNNDSHFDLITAGGLNLIIIYIEYDQKVNQYGTQLEDWAYNLLGTYSSRKAIVVTHALAGNNATPGTNEGTPPNFYSRAEAVYNRLKTRKNLFLMLGGHVGGNGEGYRMDTYQGSTVKSYVSGYQVRTNGGNGWMRLMTFSKNNDLVKVRTYSPTLGAWETDGDSQFTKPLFHEVSAVRTSDFNNDGKSNLALFNAGVWKVNGMANITYGIEAGDIPVPGDYDADGSADIAIFRQDSPYNSWIIRGISTVTFGQSGDIPVQGDYDGNGTTDMAVWRPSSAEWIIKYSNSSSVVSQIYGSSADIPVPADYDGDGKVDIAVYVKNISKWLIMGSGTPITYGVSGDIPVPGDYINSSGSAVGDGEVDIAVFRRSNNGWYVRGRATNPVIIPGMGTPQTTDIPAPGDYNGDGKTDMAVYRTSTKTLYIEGGSMITLGATGDKLLNLPYHIRKFFFP